MATATFDTLKFANRLKQAGVPAPQAEAEAEALAEALQVNLRDLATKSDLSAVRDELKRDLAAVRDELKRDLAAVHDELKRDLAAVRDELKSDARDSETRARGRIDTLESKMDGKFLLLQWMLGLLLGGILALVLKAFF
jgi:coiled-coil family 90 protein